MAFFDVAALRTVLDTESDSDSPLSEELMSQLRENFEALLLLLFKVSAGTATADPPNDSTGYFEDTAAGFSDDEHNGRTLLITSGNAKGNFYTIDDTVGASNRVECTGDNLYSDGVRSGDAYMILYDLTNTFGHDHDGINSKISQSPEWFPFLGMTGVLGTTSASYETVGGSYFYKKSFHGTIRAVYHLANGASQAAYAKLVINSTDYCEVNHTGATFTQKEATADISGLTDNTLYHVQLQMKQIGGGTAQCRQFGVFVE